MLPDFLLLHPRVQARMQTGNHQVDVIADGVDSAIGVRTRLHTDANLVLRRFGPARTLLAASPALLDVMGRPADAAGLSNLPALSMHEHEGAQVCELVGADGSYISIKAPTRLICGDFAVMLEPHAAAWLRVAARVCLRTGDQPRRVGGSAARVERA